MSRRHRSSRHIAEAATCLLVAAGTALVPTAATATATATATADGTLPAANAVLTWNDTAGAAALAACIAPSDNPLHESRMYAMMHIAIHDALNAIDRRSEPYAFRGHATGRTSAEAAVAAAAHDTLVSTVAQIPDPFTQECRDAGSAVVNDEYTAALALIPDGPAKARGVTLGQHAATAVIARRVGDGSDTPLIDPDYPQGTQPGEYRFTPDRPFAFAPGWGDVVPFTLRNADQFRPSGPPALDSAAYTRDFREVKRLGGDGVTTPTDRTPAQTETALFWMESSPLSWNRLARSVAQDRNLNLWQSARLFGLLNMAMADGYIGSFRTKYDVNFWRPVTAIRAADTDGNGATSADSTWTPLQITPAIPDYDSAHAVEGAAAAAVLREFLGTDRIDVTVCSRTLPAGATCTDATPVTHHFTRISQAAAENGEARILIGFHFRSAVTAGLERGTRIGAYAVRTFLRPC